MALDKLLFQVSSSSVLPGISVRWCAACYPNNCLTGRPWSPSVLHRRNSRTLFALGRPNRVHADLQPFCSENLTQTLNTPEEMERFFDSKVLIQWEGGGGDLMGCWSD